MTKKTKTKSGIHKNIYHEDKIFQLRFSFTKVRFKTKNKKAALLILKTKKF